MKPLIVGELFPYALSSSGSRLCTILGLSATTCGALTMRTCASVSGTQPRPAPKALKPVKLTNNDKATLRLAALIESGRTITVDAAWGYVTVGRYTPAVGPQGFAVYGYRTDNFTGAEFTGPTASAAAARQAVAVCGSTRVLTPAVELSKEIET